MRAGARARVLAGVLALVLERGLSRARAALQPQRSSEVRRGTTAAPPAIRSGPYDRAHDSATNGYSTGCLHACACVHVLSTNLCHVRTEKLLKTTTPSMGATCTVPISAALADGHTGASPAVRGASQSRLRPHREGVRLRYRSSGRGRGTRKFEHTARHAHVDGQVIIGHRRELGVAHDCAKSGLAGCEHLQALDAIGAVDGHLSKRGGRGARASELAANGGGSSAGVAPRGEPGACSPWDR